MSAIQPVFPYPGSFALHVDLDLRPPQPCELVRIKWRRQGFAAVDFPLREGGEPKLVAETDLLDATPLDAAERRELADLQRALKDRIPRTAAMKARAERCEQLRLRCIWARFMRNKLAQLNAGEAQQEAA